MTTEPALASAAPAAPVAPAPAPPETADSITSLPLLPNPMHPRNAGPLLSLNAQVGLRVTHLLHDEALSGALDLPYPTNFDYPLPPLPAVPAVPTRVGASRRGRPPAAKKARPVVNVPMPASYPLSKPMTLAEAVAVHNATVPTMPASLHYNDSALLIHMQGKLFCWALLRNLSASDASEILISSVRFFPTRDTRPPPIHAMPPQGPAQLTSEHLTSLRLSVPVLLWRIAQTSGLVDQTCFYCGKHLRHLDGLPVGMSGFLANEPKKEAAPTTDGPVDVAEPEPEGKWVCWHPRCEP